MEFQVQLTPAQQRVFGSVLHAVTIVPVVAVTGAHGSGKTTILQQLYRETGGVFLTMRDFLEQMEPRHPLALEETFFRMVWDAMKKHQVVYVDDLSSLASVTSGCGQYPRADYLDVPLKMLAMIAAETDRTLICGSLYMPSALTARGYTFTIDDLKPDDYAALCAPYLPDKTAARLDFAKIHRFASDLDGYQLRSTCLWLQSDPELDTEKFVHYLRSAYLASNVDLDEVQDVELQNLKGIPEIIESLEANIVLPLKNDALAQELDLRPKRGVLLAGPPGTGKTTVGRALAHRLRGKFFKIDGTFISGTNRFYGDIHEVFEEAKKNAPSVIFIDDSDVIFENGEEHGLYRYLLTMLDGLESESVGQVCVIMTAMDVGAIPPALLRSGRVELWLEMPLPDAGARRDILRDHLSGLPPALANEDVSEIVAATEGFTGADLKRLIQDAKNLLAYDRARNLDAQRFAHYLLRSVQTIVDNRERYTKAEAASRARRQGERPPRFSGHFPFALPEPGFDE